MEHFLGLLEDQADQDWADTESQEDATRKTGGKEAGHDEVDSEDEKHPAAVHVEVAKELSVLGVGVLLEVVVLVSECLHC